MPYQFFFHPYLRPFRQPLATSHGQWVERAGIIICLQDATGNKFWGEIAPLPWFGSETIAEATEFCRSLHGQWHENNNIPAALPACQFAWSAALHYGHSQTPLQFLNHDVSWSVLLPAGSLALQSWQVPWQQGSRTFKWKIGVSAIADEIEIFHQLLAMLPSGAQLRLDANGGLTAVQTAQWLAECEVLNNIEFIEQPLLDIPVMQQLADRYRTPLALDESVSNMARLRACYAQGWRGIFVVKPAIAGDLRHLTDFIQERQLDVVCSTSLESPVGQGAIMSWATEQGFNRRAMGFGVQHWFADNLAFLPAL